MNRRQLLFGTAAVVAGAVVPKPVLPFESSEITWTAASIGEASQYRFVIYYSPIGWRIMPYKAGRVPDRSVDYDNFVGKVQKRLGESYKSTGIELSRGEDGVSHIRLFADKVQIEPLKDPPTDRFTFEVVPASTYKVFIGGWCGGHPPDWVTFEQGGLTWDEAKAVLTEKLKAFEQDDCEHCRDQAASELASLEQITPGMPVCAFVDGDDYLIMREF